MFGDVIYALRRRSDPIDWAQIFVSGCRVIHWPECWRQAYLGFSRCIISGQPHARQRGWTPPEVLAAYSRFGWPSAEEETMAHRSLSPVGSALMSSDPFLSLQRGMNRLFDE